MKESQTTKIRIEMPEKSSSNTTLTPEVQDILSRYYPDTSLAPPPDDPTTPQDIRYSIPSINLPVRKYPS
jgi:hypothetical protein